MAVIDEPGFDIEAIAFQKRRKASSNSPQPVRTEQPVRPRNNIYIEEHPDGRRFIRSDRSNSDEALREIMEYERLRGGSGGGTSGGTGAIGPSVAEVAEQFRTYKKGDGWENPRTYSQGAARLARVIEWLGKDKVFSSLTRKDVVAVRNTIAALYDPQRTRRAAKDGTMSKDTARSHLQICKALIAFAVDQEIITQNIASDVQLALGGKKKTQSGYLPFERNEVSALLNGYIYSNAEMSAQRDLLDAYFWQPFIALHSGARIGELSQLSISDIDYELHPESGDRIWFFYLIDEELEQALKTESSRRQVPIHSAILQAGFLEFVEKRRSDVRGDGSQPLFPAPASSREPNATRQTGRWFNGESKFEGYLDTCNVKKRERKCFHSFRHTCTRVLRTKGFDNDAIGAAVGHEPSTMTGRYGNGYSLERLQEIIEAIDYGLDLAHISYERFCEYQACRGRPEKNAHLLAAYKRKQVRTSR